MSLLKKTLAVSTAAVVLSLSAITSYAQENISGYAIGQGWVTKRMEGASPFYYFNFMETPMPGHSYCVQAAWGDNTDVVTQPILTVDNANGGYHSPDALAQSCYVAWGGMWRPATARSHDNFSGSRSIKFRVIDTSYFVHGFTVKKEGGQVVEWSDLEIGNSSDFPVRARIALSSLRYGSIDLGWETFDPGEKKALSSRDWGHIADMGYGNGTSMVTISHDGPQGALNGSTMVIRNESNVLKTAPLISR